MTNEDKAKAIAKALRKHPYVKAMKKAFAPPIYHPIQRIKWQLNIKTQPLFVREEDDHGFYGKRFNREHFITKFLLHFKRMQRIIAAKELYWIEDAGRWDR